MNDLLGILFLATLLEGFITYLFGEGQGEQRNYLKYVSLAFGIIVAVAYKIDIPAMVGLISPYPFVSFILSGLVLGRGSNYVNDLIGSFRKK